MVYVFLAKGFEEIEAICPIDILKRAGVSVTLVGIGGEFITGAHGITVKTDVIGDSIIDFGNAEMIVLPGGMPGTKNLDASPVVERAIKTAVANNLYLAAICAAPSILGTRGLLRGKKAVCFPGFEDKLYGADVQNISARVVVDGKIITAAGAGVAAEFGFTLVSMLKGKTCAKALQIAMLASKF